MPKAGTESGGRSRKSKQPSRIERIKRIRKVFERPALLEPTDTRVELVLRAAERSGLLHGKSGRIGVRVSPKLVERAKQRTGIAADTDLIAFAFAFAFANLALEDEFPSAFAEARSTVDPELKLGF